MTFDPARPVIERGAVYIGDDEKIAAVQGSQERAPSGFGSAPRLRTGGTIYPGLMDLHNHMVYNALSLWSPPGRTQPYTSRYDWPKHGSYDGLISDPANALGALAGKALLKYVETKAVIGGVTAIQGSAKMAHPDEGWLVRNVEEETFQTGKRFVLPPEHHVVPVNRLMLQIAATAKMLANRGLIRRGFRAHSVLGPLAFRPLVEGLGDGGRHGREAETAISARVPYLTPALRQLGEYITFVPT